MRQAAAQLESMVQSTAWRLSSTLHSSPHHATSDSSLTSSASSSPSSSFSPPPSSLSPPSSSASSTALPPGSSSGPLLPIHTFLSSSMSLLDDNGGLSFAEALPSDLLLHSAMTESCSAAMLAGEGEGVDDSYMFPPSSFLVPPSSAASTSPSVSSTSSSSTTPSLYTMLPGPWEPSEPIQQTPVPCGADSGGFLPDSLLGGIDVSSSSFFPPPSISSPSTSSSSLSSLSIPFFSTSSPSSGSLLGGIDVSAPYFTSSSSSSSSSTSSFSQSSCLSSSVHGGGEGRGAGCSLPLTVAAADFDGLFDNRPTKELDDVEKARRKQWKAYMRRERNKAAARKSNENKKILKEQLENKSIELKEENIQLHHEIQELRHKLRHLSHVQSSMRHVCCPARRQRLHHVRATCQ